MGGLFSQSVGKKLLMSLAGLFLLTFLLVHLSINLLVLCDTTQYFNIAANFMASNIIIKIFEVVLFGGLIIHLLYAGILSVQNKIARPIVYKKANNSQTSFFSKYMVHTAVIIGIFLVIHIMDFYVKAKYGHEAVEVTYDGGLTQYEDMGALVIAKFKMLGFVIAYIVSFIFLGFHLLHGFQSAFQTLGINHPVYTPIIKIVGVIYSLIITIGFSIIPIVIYFFR